jgi:ribose transport system permease protein
MAYDDARLHGPVNETAAEPVPSSRLPLGIQVLVFARDRGIIILWLVLLGVFAVWARPYFATVDNGIQILSAAALTGIFAAGVAISAMSGSLDLSVPGVAAFAGIVAGKLIVDGQPVWLAILACLAVGVAAGVFNGLVTLRGLNSLIVTIGTLSVLTGLSSVLSDGYTVPGLDALGFMGTTRYLRVPAQVYIVVALYIVLTIFVTKTRGGIRLMAVGGNAEAVRRVGIDAARYQLLGFVLCAMCSALGGLATAAYVTEASPQASPGIIFQALTAVALAGVSLAGGRGSLPKVLVGAIILATIGDGLTIAGVQPYWATVATGALLISALVLDKMLTRAISDRLVAVAGVSAHSVGAR